MKTGLKVGEAMTKRPVRISKDRTVREGADMMADNHVGGLLVVSNGKPEGIVTEQDIVRKVVAEGKDPQSTKLDELTQRKLHTISPGADIYEALVMMRDLNIRHLPVVEDNETMGMLTLKDILKIQPSLFDLMVEKIELREEEFKPVGDE